MSPDFFFDQPTGVVSPDALGQFCAQLPHINLKALASAYEGRVLRCENPIIIPTEDGATVQIANIVAVLAGEVIVDESLRVEVPHGHTQVFLALDRHPKWLDSRQRVGIQSRAAKGELVRRASGDAVLPVVRLTWAPTATLPDRPVPTLDALWWPKVARVTSDPRSAGAARLLADTLATTAPSLVCRLGQAARGETGWEHVIVDVLRHCESRWQDDPDRTGRLSAIAEMPDQADQVTALIGFLRAEHGHVLPNTLPEDRSYSLCQTLLPKETRTSRRDGRASLDHDYTGPSRPGLLAAAITGSGKDWYRVTVRVNGEDRVFARQANQGAESLLAIQPSAPFTLSIQCDGATPIAPVAVVAGLYSKKLTANG
jgi:hypothetical protein